MTTTRSDIFERVKSILKEELFLSAEKTQNITRLTNVCTDLGADDLDGVEVIIEFENQFGISISEEECSPILEEGGKNFTVGNCVDLLCQKLGIK